MIDYSQSGEQKKVLKYFEHYRPVHRILVDIGAFGKYLSNTFALLETGWRGILIEPSPNRIETVKQDFAGKDVEILNIAIGAEEKEMDFYLHSVAGHDSLLPDWYPDTLMEHSVVKVRTRVLADVLEERGIPHDFDLLSIDAEGMDFVIVEQLFQSKYRPRMVIVEDLEKLEKKELFAAEGYRVLARTNVNTIWVSDDGELVDDGAEINYNFLDGPFVGIAGGSTGELHHVTFKDVLRGEVVYQSGITNGHWAKANRRYYTQWEITVATNDRKCVLTNDLEDRDVHIRLKSYSLGDNIAWMPYVEKFRRRHNCRIQCSTAWNDILEGAYPEIEFIPHEGHCSPSTFARYTVGIWRNDVDWQPGDWRTISVQQYASRILGLPDEEIRPRVDESRIYAGSCHEKYVCISARNPNKIKLWHYPNGWQTVVDSLVRMGYKVISIAKEGTDLKNVIDASGNSIEVTMGILRGCELYIGLASGLAWLAWALGKRVVMISGFSEPWVEFKENNYRVAGQGDCVCCYNDIHVYDDGNCPRNKDFQCSRLITPEHVLLKVWEALDET